MDKKIKKIFVFVLILLLLIIFFLSILGFADIINFWIAAVIISVFAFFVLPKIK